jgi:flagellar biosynthetic protein FlhB
MAEDSDQERTEEASAKRLQDAREKGQIARSRELNSFLMVFGSGAALMAMAGYVYQGLERVLRAGFVLDRAQLFDPQALIRVLSRAVEEMLITLAPLFVVTVIIALAAPLAIGGWAFSGQALAFKLDRLGPLKGLKRVFGPQGLVELAKALAKFLLVLCAAVALIWMWRSEILGLAGESVETGILHSFSLVGWTLLGASACLIVVAAVDAPFQIWNYHRELRMTRQEVRDELKDTEGKPEVKRKVREMQNELASRRMMANVPKADVVITNPTHFAVALKYDASKMAAPVVVAKGADLVASEIRRIAVESRVPLMSAPPLARSIYYTTDIDMPIPAGLYKAVAMVLAYVYQTKRKRWTYSSRPMSLRDLPIPEDLRRDEVSAPRT